MVKNGNKSGFSLFEACVVMLIVGIFTALCANSYSKRHVTYQESDGHGRYECYRNSAGTLMQRYVENNNSRNVTGSICVFRPPRYAKYILLNAVGGGSTTGAGVFQSMFYSSVDEPLTVEPGTVGNATTIKEGSNTLLTAEAGGGSLITTNSTMSTVKDCQFIDNKYSCSGTPVCMQDGVNLAVSYCSSANEFVTDSIPLAYIKTYSQSQTSDSVVYKDLSDMTKKGVDYKTASEKAGDPDLEEKTNYEIFYTKNVKFDTTLTSVSQMESYLESLSIDDGIASVQPGRPNKPGGVIILW